MQIILSIDYHASDCHHSSCFGFSLRIGFCTGPAPLIRQIQMHMMVSVMHTATLSQVRRTLYASQPHCLRYTIHCTLHSA